MRDSDLYIGLFGFHYGLIPEGHDRSFTHLEFDAAREAGVDTLIFLAKEAADWPFELVDPPTSAIYELRRHLLEQYAVGFFSSPDNLASGVLTALASWAGRRQLTVRSDDDSPLVFLAYDRADSAVVSNLAEELGRLGLSVWRDVEQLQPGQLWQNEIGRAVRAADAVLFFASASSVRSTWVEAELGAFAEQGERLLLPIRLDDTDWSLFPPSISGRQGIDLQRPDQVESVAGLVASAVRTVRPIGKADATETVALAAQLSAGLAAEIPGSREERRSQPAEPVRDAVFVVHGHDQLFLHEVKVFLSSLAIESIVLGEIGGASYSLFARFREVADEAEFAVVLLSADDRGAARKQYDAPGVADKALQFRARQNVILELGFFYGRLSFENVFVLTKAPDEVYPDFERPSDLDGVVFDDVRSSVDWHEQLSGRLHDAGFQVPRSEV